ncbi:MAG TPA: hypothetical protein VGY76_14145 [Solirubrobacteraceae bacterium]|jgi:hypothetical protein|nr:hypothetical protein [Solirubrobacteraceae bacterium]
MAVAVMLLAGVIGLLVPASSRALIHPATVVDGPANDVLEVDGTAMARDGSGGIVYRKRVNGVTHVFAARFESGGWSSPVQVDVADTLGASQPAIAAGEGGRLLVVWVQVRNVNSHGISLYELMSASSQPGARGFGPPIIVDANVGEPYTGDVSAVNPKLAMAPNGAAYLVYRVITNDCLSGFGDPQNGSCPLNGTEKKLVDVRVARYNYLLWSTLGAVNRASQVAMPTPTDANAPAIGIDGLSGNGVVTWQEPDSSGAERIFVRRLFGTVQGNVLQASPDAIGGRPVTSDADAPTVAVSPEGAARIVYRIAGLAGSAVRTTSLFVNLLPSAVDFHGSRLATATLVPGAVQAGMGTPAAVVDRKGNFRLAWTQGGVVEDLTGNEEAIGSPLQVGFSAGRAFTTINPSGGGTTAWAASTAGLSVVGVREDYSQGAYQTARLAGTVPGGVDGLSLGGDGQGDALLGWTQGPPGASEVAGAFVQAPPGPLQVLTPPGWVRARSASVSWTASFDAVPGISYAVYVDGHPRARGLTRLQTSLDPKALGDGTHSVQVLATSGDQQTMSPASPLKIDANPPIVRITRTRDGRGVHVSVRDRASGVDARATRISFGDGGRSRGRTQATHEYGGAGVYSITAQVRDRVGNRATVRLRMSVR